MKQSDIESILWDCVNTPTEDDSYLGHQTSGITKLAELITEQNRRIGEVEAKIAELTADRSTEK
jgi:hypothetical protein